MGESAILVPDFACYVCIIARVITSASSAQLDHYNNDTNIDNDNMTTRNKCSTEDSRTVEAIGRLSIGARKSGMQ